MLTPARWTRAIARGLVLFASACTDPHAATPSPAPSPPRGADVAPLGAPHAISDVTLPRDRGIADPSAPPLAPDPAPPPRDTFADEGDVALFAAHLGVGTAAHRFDVARACPLGRIELDVELDSMPDGVVTLRAPWGAEARLPLHVLTTTHFIRTWDWAMLEAFHGERGRDVAGAWTLDARLAGATYAGGTQPAAPMPTPAIVSAALRLWCEPDARARADASADVTVARDAPPASRRPGASVRVLLPVHEDCDVARVAVTLREHREIDGIGSHFQLVTPSGDVTRLAIPLFGARRATEREAIVDRGPAVGASTRGLWEIRAHRAAGLVTLDHARLTFACRPR